MVLFILSQLYQMKTMFLIIPSSISTKKKHYHIATRKAIDIFLENYVSSFEI